MGRGAVKIYDAQAAADKTARRLCREAYERGGTVPYSLSRLLDLKLSVKMIRAIVRPAAPVLRCGRCKVDRLVSPCPNSDGCPMVGDAQGAPQSADDKTHG